jgi:putative membrane protein
MVAVLAQMMDRDDMNAGGHWWAWLIGVAVLAAIVGLVIWAVVRTTTQPSSSTPVAPGRRSAEEVLADRLARGEIDTEEYRQRLSALRDH